MVTITFTGTPSEVFADMREMLMHQEQQITIDPRQMELPLSRAEKFDDVDSVMEATARAAEGPTRTRTEVATILEEAAEKPKRKRRTKAEIDAAKSNGARNPEEEFEVKKHTQEPADEEETAENESPAIVQMQKTENKAAPIANKEAVHQALQQVNVAVGLPKAREILDSFQVKRLSEIKPDQYVAFIEKCNEAVMLEG